MTTSLRHIPLLPVEEQQRQQRRASSPDEDLWQLLDAVMDPEIPVVSIWELGVLQDVVRCEDRVTVTITPTYSGCPAMTVMAEDIRLALARAGCSRVDIITQLAPAWSSRWLSAAAQEKLRGFGIAPPDSAISAETEGATSNETSHGADSTTGRTTVRCPRCGSVKTHVVSAFGSTACKSLHQCEDCAEPFDHFKPF